MHSHAPVRLGRQEQMRCEAQSGSKRQNETDDNKWWWFNDDKVTEVEAEKIETLAGGGKCITQF